MPLSRFVYDPWEIPPEQRKATFVGREPILDRLLAAIREQEGRATVQHYILTGPRGIGKTSLLLTLRDRIRRDAEISPKWFCVQLREEEYYVHKQRDLWQLVLEALAVEEKVEEARQVVKQAEEIPDNEKSSALLVDGLRSICQRHGKRLALLVDNFGQIFPTTAAGEAKHRKPDSEYRAFRKRLSTEAFLMLIATSVKLFQDIYAYDKGFFHFFSPVELPELTQEEFVEMLRRLGGADESAAFVSRLEQSKGNLRTLYFLTGGNPRFVTVLYQILAQNEMSEPVQALWETVAGLTPMLRHELADIPRQQSKTLDALLRLNGVAAPADIAKSSRLPLNVVTTQLGRLREARYVTLEGGGKGKRATYRVADQMFSVWYWMRYVPVARRRIELFIDFLRAWFSVEERRSLFEDRWERFHSCHSRGLVGMAGKALRDAEYYAASLEDPTERNREMERIADAYITAGDWPSAAALFAELAGMHTRSIEKFESLGYELLGGRFVAKGDVEHAIKSFSEAIKKDPTNADARVNLAMCFVLRERFGDALAQFDLVAEKACLRSEALFARGFAKMQAGDLHGALADYSAIAELPGEPLEYVASALFFRGVFKEKSGNSEGARADYTAVIEFDGVSANRKADALNRRGQVRLNKGDPDGAMADYTAVLELHGAPPEHVAKALLFRGIAKSEAGDLQGTILDCSAVVGLSGARRMELARAFFQIGSAKSKLGDRQGAIEGYTEAIELEGAPVGQLEAALLMRANEKSIVGDLLGAIADCNSLVELQSSPTEMWATGVMLRGHLNEKLGRHDAALHDFNMSLEFRELSEGARIQVIFNRGVTHENLGNMEQALADYSYAALSGAVSYVYLGIRSVVRVLLAQKKVGEALGWVERIHQIEPRDVPFEKRLEERLDMIRAAATVASLEQLSNLVDALLETDPEELRARLQFLKPGLELVRTNGQSVLANLPEDERKMAREIARTLAEAARPVVVPPMGSAGGATRGPTPCTAEVGSG